MFQNLDAETILQQRHMGEKWQMLKVNIFVNFFKCVTLAQLSMIKFLFNAIQSNLPIKDKMKKL